MSPDWVHRKFSNPLPLVLSHPKRGKVSNLVHLLYLSSHYAYRYIYWNVQKKATGHIENTDGQTCRQVSIYGQTDITLGRLLKIENNRLCYHLSTRSWFANCENKLRYRLRPIFLHESYYDENVTKSMGQWANRCKYRCNQITSDLFNSIFIFWSSFGVRHQCLLSVHRCVGVTDV